MNTIALIRLAKELIDMGLENEADSILEEIDAVLEKNAEEFVKGFIQKGGQ